jgi:hypothetical protein
MINELQSIMSDIAAEIEAKKHIVGRLSRCEPCARRERRLLKSWPGRGRRESAID